MLTFENVDLHGDDPPGLIFSDLSFRLGRRRALVIAEHDDLTSGLVNLAVGTRLAERGKVQLAGRPSWPIGQSMIVRGPMTGRETIRFLGLLYNLDVRACMADARRWFEDDLLSLPMTRWSTRERTRFERLAVLWPDFDVLLAFGAAPTGDPAFDAEWTERFGEKLTGRGLIAVAPPFDPWSEWCDVVVLLRSTEAVFYATVAEALSGAKAAATGALVEEPKRREQIDDDLF